MHDSVCVAVGSALEDLVGEAFDFLRGEGTAYMSHVLFQVEFAVLEDQV